MMAPMSDAGALAEVFDGERPRLVGLVYRMTGSYADAEEVVQEAWIRFARSTEPIANPAAWLTTVTSRLALDRLRTLARRREDYVGPWLPEPIGAVGADPEDLAVLADSLTFAFLVLLDQLTPIERVVFLLADVFGEPYARIAEIVGRSEAACRQIASRARRRIAPDQVPSRPTDAALLERLVTAVVSGDEAEVVALLHPDVRLLSDGGPHRHAARRPVVGPDRVARLLAFLGRRAPPGLLPGWGTINGQPALVIRSRARVELVLLATERDGRVVAVEIVLNPEKLRNVDSAVSIL